MQHIFGTNNPGAIKIIVMAMIVGLFVWIFWARNMSLPVLPKITLAKQGERQEKNDKKPRKRIIEEEIDEEDDENTHDDNNASLVSVFKSSLKEKVTKKIQEKEAQKVIRFPKDKPTYDCSLLE